MTGGARLAVLAVVATGCIAAPRAQTCLSGPMPGVGRPGADESYAQLRRELTRAGDRTSVAAARIIEHAPELVPDASDLAGEPACASELVDTANVELFAGVHVRFSRRTVAWVRAVARVGDTSDVMEAKARFLIAVAELRDDQITDYQLDGDEPGPPPPKRYLRDVAIAGLGDSSIVHNVRAAAAWIPRAHGRPAIRASSCCCATCRRR
nr:hypothetical protein [Kofleriaceae bacterium]